MTNEILKDASKIYKIGLEMGYEVNLEQAFDLWNKYCFMMWSSLLWVPVDTKTKEEVQEAIEIYFMPTGEQDE